MKKVCTNMWNHIWKNRRALFIGMLLVSVMLAPHFALAQNTPPPGPPPVSTSTPATAITSSAKTDDIADTIMSFANIIQSLLQRILWPVLLLIGGLLKNDILFGAGMEDRLLAVWGVIRNLVNVAFVLVLLGIAFYNVMGLGQNYHLKTKLPVFIIALVAVNFSFLGVKVILDAINVVSTAIFALPYTVTQDQGAIPDQKNFAKKICESLHGYKTDDYKKSVTDWGESSLCNKDTATFTKKGEAFFNRWDGRNAAVALAVNLINATSLDKVFPNQKATITSLALNSLFSVIFYIIYATAFVTLFIVLVARLVVLWLALVLSPLMVLPYVLPDSIKGALGEGNNLREQFVSNAIAPIPIAVVMTVGFILLQHFKKADFGSLTFSGTTLGANLLVSGLTTLQELIANIAMIAFLWKGIFAAADKSAAKGIIEKIKGGVESAGKFVGSSWQYIPMFPVAVGDGTEPPHNMSVAGTLNMMNQMQSVRDQAASEEGVKNLKLMTGKDAILAANDIRKSKNIADLKRYLKLHENHMNSEDAQKALAEILEKNPGWKKDAKLNNIPGSIRAEVGNNLDDMVKKLKEGKVSPTSMKEYIKENTKDVKPDAAPDQTAASGQPAAQQPGQPAAIGYAKAKAMIDDADTAAYIKNLDPAEQKLLDGLKNPPKGKEDEAAQKAQNVLKKIEDAHNEVLDFRTELMNAGSAQEIEQKITERKNKLQSQFKDKAGEVVKAEITQSPDVDKHMKAKGVDAGSTPVLNPSPPAAQNPPASAAATVGH